MNSQNQNLLGECALIKDASLIKMQTIKGKIFEQIPPENYEYPVTIIGRCSNWVIFTSKEGFFKKILEMNLYDAIQRATSALRPKDAKEARERYAQFLNQIPQLFVV